MPMRMIINLLLLLAGTLSTCGVGLLSDNIDPQVIIDLKESLTCPFTLPDGFRHIADCQPIDDPRVYCYQATEGENVSLSFNTSLPEVLDNAYWLNSLSVRYAATSETGHYLQRVDKCDPYGWSRNCSISAYKTMAIGGQSNFYRFQATVRRKGHTMFCTVFVQIDVRFETERLTWKVNDNRLWYHVRQDEFYLSPNSEAKGYPYPDRYTLTTDNGTLLMDFSTEDIPNLSYKIQKSDFGDIKSLTLTAFARDQSISRTVMVKDILKNDNSLMIWRTLAIAATGVILFILGTAHVVIYRKSICKWMQRILNRQISPPASRDQTLPVKLTLTVNNVGPTSGTTVSPQQAQSDETEIELGEHAPPASIEAESVSLNSEARDDGSDLCTDGVHEIDVLKHPESQMSSI